jgi:polyhydroxyalkanoate synthesis regulator phasin
MPIKFDTLGYARKLREAGVPQTQAEAQAQALHEALSEGTVTPGDMLMLKSDLIARLEMVKHDVDNLKREVEILRHDVDILKQDVQVLKQDVHILKRKVSVLSWLVGLSLVMHAVEIAALLHIIGRLP